MTDDRARPFVELMRSAGAPEAAIGAFVQSYERLLGGSSGTIGEAEIEPAEGVADAGQLAEYADAGRRAMDRAVVIKLNGGLGTSMGLERAKSLLEVREGLTFLDIIARNVLAVRERTGARVPLVLMNSFRTEADTLRHLERYPDLRVADLPLTFVQNRVPKVDAETLAPSVSDAESPLGWCPPGHGDLYTALGASGTLQRLLEAGFEYAFASNADNLGAVPSPELLGYMAAEEVPFLMEVADRTPADRKGGHLARLRGGGLILRESAQCPPDEADAFQDVERYRYFNTNNLWVHLPALRDQLEAGGGFLDLPTIVNRKRLDPRNPGSPPVVQLETAMGSAVGLFPGARAVRIDRRRFSPVKKTDDLLAVRSDAYELTDDGRIALAAGRGAPPDVRLDPEYFALIDGFDERFARGVPSLLECERLAVRGNVYFGAGVRVRGAVSVTAGDEPAEVPSDELLDDDVTLG